MRWLGSKCAGSAVQVDPPLPNWRCPRPGRSDPSGSCQSPGSRISPGPLRTRRVRRHNQTKTLENKLHLPFTFENFEAESGHSCLIFAAKRPNDLFDISAVQLVDSRSLISGVRPELEVLGSLRGMLLENLALNCLTGLMQDFAIRPHISHPLACVPCRYRQVHPAPDAGLRRACRERRGQRPEGRVGSLR